MEAAQGRSGGGGPPRTGAPARSMGMDGQGRMWQFTKTKLCKFNIIGMCVKGESCPFAHEKDELRPLPDLTCTKLCKQLIQTGSCEDRSCTYAHTKDELRATSTFHKTKLCRFSQIGHCALGSKCNFAHSVDEVRPLESPMSQAASREAPPPQMGLYSDQQLNDAHMLLQQQLMLAQQQQQQQQQPQQQGDAGGYMVPPQYFAGLNPQTFMTAVGLQDSTRRAPAAAMTGGAVSRGKRDPTATPGAPVGPQGPSGQYPMGANTMAPQMQSAGSMPQQRRRGGRRGKEGRDGGKAGHGGKGRGKGGEAEVAETSPGQKSIANTFDSASSPSMTGMTENDMAGRGSGMGGMGAMGPMAGMPGLEWIARQGAPQMTNAQVPGLSMPEAPYGSGHSASFGNQLAANSSEDFRDCPAYVTQTASDFVVKNTFLELGPIGGPLRPVRSAAGRLDVLGGSAGDSSEGLCDLAAGLASHGSAGSLSTEDRTGGEYGSGDIEGMGQAPPRTGMGPRYFDEADAGGIAMDNVGDLPGGGNGMRSDCTPQSGFGRCEGAGAGEWGEAMLNGSFTINQKDDVWQVKNTFLTFTPQTKPIRSVRTAEGALCTLGALGDDEP
mmetsp:Transcript_74884/g.219373  ORF Transcript_74884/g.219373 Transcript_74884/m.219373 type:complete len:608 (-) Transcript_74884:299-2122(-)